MGMVRKASSHERSGPSAKPATGPVFHEVRGPTGASFSVMDRGSFSSAAARADKVFEKIMATPNERSDKPGRRK